MTDGIFSIDVRVYIEDTDAAGIVYYVNYMKFMERARTELLRSLGFQHYTFMQDDVQFVVHRCDIQYKQAARMDDALLVTAEVVKVRKASVTFLQRVWRKEDNMLLTEATVVIACVKKSSLAPRGFPIEFQSAFESVVSSD